MSADTAPAAMPGVDEKLRRARPSLDEGASPEAFGAASALCQGYFPACSDRCECQNGGECFRPDGIAYAAAKRAMSGLISSTVDPRTRVWLTTANRLMEEYHRDAAAIRAQGE